MMLDLDKLVVKMPLVARAAAGVGCLPPPHPLLHRGVALDLCLEARL